MLLDLVEEAYAIYSTMENGRAGGWGLAASYAPEILLTATGVSVKAPIFKKVIDAHKQSDTKSNTSLASQIINDIQLPPSPVTTPAEAQNSKFHALQNILKFCAELYLDAADKGAQFIEQIDSAKISFLVAFHDSSVSQEQKDTFLKKVYCFGATMQQIKNLLQVSEVETFIQLQARKHNLDDADYLASMREFIYLELARELQMVLSHFRGSELRLMVENGQLKTEVDRLNHTVESLTLKEEGKTTYPEAVEVHQVDTTILEKRLIGVSQRNDALQETIECLQSTNAALEAKIHQLTVELQTAKAKQRIPSPLSQQPSGLKSGSVSSFTGYNGLQSGTHMLTSAFTNLFSSGSSVSPQPSTTATARTTAQLHPDVVTGLLL